MRKISKGILLLMIISYFMMLFVNVVEAQGIIAIIPGNVTITFVKDTMIDSIELTVQNHTENFLSWKAQIIQNKQVFFTSDARIVNGNLYDHATMPIPEGDYELRIYYYNKSYSLWLFSDIKRMQENLDNPEI